MEIPDEEENSDIDDEFYDTLLNDLTKWKKTLKRIKKVVRIAKKVHKVYKIIHHGWWNKFIKIYFKIN